jgi:DNA-binding transcriptional LysR family regulator
LPTATQDIGTDLLRTLVFVVEERSYTRAAQRLRLSQPTVSAHIKRLQDQLGYDVFDKSVPGVKLTAKGEFALARARQMLTLHEQMLRGEDLSQTGGALIRVGAPEEVLSMAPMMAAILRDNPAINFHVERNVSAKLRERFHAGEIDVCVMLDREQRIEDADIHGSDTLVWTGAKLNKASTTPLNIVAPPAHCISHEIMLETLNAHRANYRIAVQSATMNGAVNSAAAGLGYLALLRSAVPPTLAEVGHETGLPPIKIPLFWSISIHRHAGRGAWTSAAEHFATFLAHEMGHREPLKASGGGRR